MFAVLTTWDRVADVVDGLSPLEEGDDGQLGSDLGPLLDPCPLEATPSGIVPPARWGCGEVAQSFKTQRRDGQPTFNSSDTTHNMPANARRRSPRFLPTPPSSVLSDLDQTDDPSSQRSTASPRTLPVDGGFQTPADKALSPALVQSSDLLASSSSASDIDVTRLTDLRSVCLTPSTSPEPEISSTEDRDTPAIDATCEVPLASRPSARVYKKAAISAPTRRSTRNPEYHPLGPRHLEEEYHDAYQDFRHVVLQAVYSLGFDPKKVRDGRPVGRSTPPTVEEIMSLRLPSITIAKRRVDEADRRLNEAIARGFTWENTRLPKYEVTYDDKGDVVSVVMVEDPLDAPEPPKEVIAPLPRRQSKRKLESMAEPEEPRRSKRQRPQIGAP
jgi:hypothetical protein